MPKRTNAHVCTLNVIAVMDELMNPNSNCPAIVQWDFQTQARDTADAKGERIGPPKITSVGLTCVQTTVVITESDAGTA